MKLIRRGRRNKESPESTEISAVREQLLVFAREISSVYHRERKQAAHLGELLEELKEDYLSIIQTLALLVEAKDQYTRYHLDRCREYGTALASEIDPALVTPELKYGFLLHDVGKIGIPEAILAKRGPLSDQERKIINTHPLVGVQLVLPMRRIMSAVTVEVIRNHHERYDGTGYPDRLRGNAIPISARIFSVVDAYDAMTTDRPYRDAIGYDEAIVRIRDGAGTQFDPDVVDAFERLMARGRDSSLDEPNGHGSSAESIN